MKDNDRVVRPRSVVTGQFTRRIERLTSSTEFLMIMVIFNPGALHRLTGIPSAILSNKHTDLESVFPRETSLISQQLSSTGSYDEMIILIETTLKHSSPPGGVW